MEYVFDAPQIIWIILAGFGLIALLAAPAIRHTIESHQRVNGAMGLVFNGGEALLLYLGGYFDTIEGWQILTITLMAWQCLRALVHDGKYVKDVLTNVYLIHSGVVFFWSTVAIITGGFFIAR